MSPFFLYVALLSVSPSLCIGRSIENRLERLEQTVHILQTALVEKDNRISHLENELSEVNQRVNVLELMLEKGANDHEQEGDTTNAAMNLETEEAHQEKNGTENVAKLQGKNVKSFKRGQSSSIHRRKLSTFPFTDRSIENTDKIAFHAYQSMDRTYGTHELMHFDMEAIDIGQGYNNADGIYTVPVTGVYVFSWTIASHSHAFHEAELLINGKEMGTVQADSELTIDQHQSTGLIVAHVNAGDHISVRIGINNGGLVISDPAHGRSTFTGWLLFTL